MRRLFATILTVAGLSFVAAPVSAAGDKQPAQSVKPGASGHSSGGGCYDEYPAQTKKPTA